MFKLESYITPIILSYVDKYVKNVKAERSQVSLWGGDALFSNLDLRLDVLERELGLPFTFLSGHIHELHIHVPWTRLHAEPIVITINTIECVLRLPGGDSSESDATSSVCSSSSARTSERKRKMTKQETEAPPGYVQSLINKIISNVKIVCNNLILKYVEEDIVLSLNTRWLSLSSANSIWEQAFTELSLPDLILRKLLQVKDMTVCLDKRDASGKIETYQEPLLYRCSLSVHAAWCYDSLHAKIPRTSRYEVRSQRLDFSLTDTQLPMFIRIFKLVLALYNGEIEQHISNLEGQDGKTGVECTSESGGDNTLSSNNPNTDSNDGGTWAGWAWNVGTSVGSILLPVYWEDVENDNDASSPALDVRREKIVHIGFFVDSASLAIKMTERHKEKSLFGSTKMKFTPFLRLDVNGMVHEAIVKGIHTVNVRGGICEISLVPQNDCMCGARDTALTNSSAEENNETKYLYAGQPQEDGKKKSYLGGSLFERDFGDETGDAVPMERRMTYEIDWDKHLDDVTEETMLERTPALALDFLYHLELPDDLSSDRISELEVDLENSNLNERALCRLVFGPTQIKVCSGSLHRLNALVYLASLYDYPPYGSLFQKSEGINLPEKTRIISQSIGDESSSVGQHGSPIRVYQITAINPSVMIFAGDHDKFILPSMNSTPIGLPRPSSKIISGLVDGRLPCLLLKMEYLDSQAVQPMYPAKLVRIVSSISNPSQTLLQLCQTSLTVKLLHASGQLVYGDQSATVLQPSNAQIGVRRVVTPELWNTDQLLHSEFNVDIHSFKFRITRPQLDLAVHIFEALLVEEQPKPAKVSDTSLLEDALAKRLPSLVFYLSSARFHRANSKDAITCHLGVKDITISLSLAFIPSQTASLPILSKAADHLSGSRQFPVAFERSPTKMSPGRARPGAIFSKLSSLEDSAKFDFLHAHVQYPRSSNNQKITTLISVQVAEFQIIIDPKLYEWMIYSPESKVPPKLDPQSDHLQKKGGTQKGGPRSFRTITSDRDDTRKFSTSKGQNVQTNEHQAPFEKKALAFISTWFPSINSSLIQVRAESVRIYFPRRSLQQFAMKSVADTISRATTDIGKLTPILGLCLPTILLENVAHKPMIQQFLVNVPIVFPESVWNIGRDNLPWTLKLKNFSVFTHNCGGSKIEILESATTNCTLGLNSRQHTEGGPTLGLCIHADMSPIKVSLRESQLSLIMDIVGESIAFAYKVCPGIFVSSKYEYADDVVGSLDKCLAPGVRSASPGPPPQLADDEASLLQHSIGNVSEPTVQSHQPHIGESLDKVEESSAMSLWLQWTLPQITSTLMVSGSSGNAYSKLVLEMEDFQSSFDWTPLYFQAKCRVLSAGLRHFVQRQGSADWNVGPFKGIVISCGDDMSRDLQTISSKTNNPETIPHSSHFEIDQSFFSLVFTRAGCNNVEKKWNELLRTSKSYRSLLPAEETSDRIQDGEENNKRFVSEVDIKFAPIDVVLEAEVLMPFVKMVSGQLMRYELPNKHLYHPNQQVIGMSINNNTLPLLYLKGKTIRIFLKASVAGGQRDDHGKLGTLDAITQPDTVLFNCDSINITPQVENKLSRILLRPELFHFSQAILNIPGSHVEDRQYEVLVSGLSVLTGRWKDIEEKSKKPEKPVLKTMGENPALEWNTVAEQSMLDGGQPFEAYLMPLVSKFELQVTFAPSIVYISPDQKKSLIAGHSLEINAKGDITFTLSTGQIQLLSTCIQQMLIITKAAMISIPSQKPASGSSLDSGVDCGEMSVLSNRRPANMQPSLACSSAAKNPVTPTRFVPVEVLMTTNKISFIVFRIDSNHSTSDTVSAFFWRRAHRRRRRLDQKPATDKGYESENSDLLTDKIRMRDAILKRSTLMSDSSTLPSLDIGYDASEEGSVDDSHPHNKLKICPLFHAFVSQPHVFLSFSRTSQKIELSIYNSALSLGAPNYFVACEDGYRLPSSSDFGSPLFETKTGDPLKKSGVLPALFSLQVVDFFNRDCRISCSIERPIKIVANLDVWKRVLEVGKDLRSFSGIDELQKLLVTEPSPRQNNSNVNVDLRSLLARISRLSGCTKQVVLYFSDVSKQDMSDKTEMIVSSQGFTVDCMFSSKMFKHQLLLSEMKNNVKIKNLMLTLGIRKLRHLLLKPWSFDVNLYSSWGNNCSTFNLNMESENLRIALGPNHIVALTLIQSRLAQNFPEFFHRDGTSTETKPNRKSLPFAEILPGTKDDESKTDQHYVDDLRAGAFQYVEGDGISRIKPYQVVFTNVPPAMTWQYPQARTLTRVSVFPVPFQSAAISPSNYDFDREVSCTLQFWDKSLNSFKTYSQFYLSEQQVVHLDLPLPTDRKKVCVSDTWRIAADIQGDAEENDTKGIIFTPKSLVSVVRVDSYYNPKLIPKIQMSLHLDKVVFALHNHLHFCNETLPPPLNSFTLCPIYPKDQEVLTVGFDSTTFGVDIWLNGSSKSGPKKEPFVDEVDFNIGMKTTVGIEFVDFRFLAKHALLVPVSAQAGMFVTLQENGPAMIDFSGHTRNISLRAGHFAARSLAVISTVWQKVLDPSKDKSMEVITDYVVCNSTLESIRFGQVDTEENILLRSNDCCLYAWRSHKAKLQLRLCVDGGFWRWCQPFSIKAGMSTLKIDHGTHVSTLVVTIRALSNSGQFKIKISGLVTTASLLRERLEVRAVLKPDMVDALADEGGKDPRYRTTLEEFSEAPSFVLHPDQVQAVKIRLSGIGTPWSGDIPLVGDKGRRNCVLIRVPTKEKGHCTTIWCKLVEETIHDNLRRVLLLFSPMYTARSALPNPMKLRVTSSNPGDPNISYEVELPGREQLVQLDTPGTADQKYNLAFQVVANLPPSDPVQMSWGIVERVRDKTYVAPSLDDIVRDLTDSVKVTTNKWPFVEMDEDLDIPETSWDGGIQPRTDVQVSFRQLHPLCNTLCVEVNPWCLVINRTGVDLFLKVSETSVFKIVNQSVFAPPSLGSTFRFGVDDCVAESGDEGEKTCFGPPLQLTDQEWHFRSMMPSVRGMIPMEGHIQTKIVCSKHMCFLTVSTKNENGMRVMEIKPTFVVTNLTNQILSCVPVSFLALDQMTTAETSLDNLSSVSVESTENHNSRNILFWNFTGSATQDQLFDGFLHMAFKSPDTKWSGMVNLEDCRNTSDQDSRRSISVMKTGRDKSKFCNLPLFVTIHQRRGRLFLVLHEDTLPQFVVHNSLKAKVFFIEVSRPEDTSTKVIHEAPPNSSYSFTSSKASDYLAKVESAKTGVKFLFSLLPGDEDGWEMVDKDRKWSDPLDSSLNHEHFISIPGYGDTTFMIEKTGNTSHIFIEPVSKVQVSAKDIRSRITADLSPPMPVQLDISHYALSSPAPSSVGTTDPEFLDSTQLMSNESFKTPLEKSLADERSFHSVWSSSSRPQTPCVLTAIDELSESSNDQLNCKNKTQVQASLFVDELSLTLLDDCFDVPNSIDEYVRITFDSVALWCRPRISNLQPLKSLGGQRPQFNDFTLTIDNLQVDNQMSRSGNFDFPVILTSQEQRKKFKLPVTNHSDVILEALKKEGTVLIQMAFDGNHETNILKVVKINIKPLKVSLEDKFVQKLVSIFNSFGPPDAHLYRTSKQKCDVKNLQLKLPRDVLLSSVNMVNAVHLDFLHIESLSALVSVRASLKIYIGLDQSPLSFSPYSRTDLITTNYSLGQSLARHYISGALFRAGWVVGSLDIIGSPAGFTRIVGDGIKDFVGLPYQGIFQGPWAFVSGITYGSSSLVKHVSAGTLTSMTNFASCVSRNLDRLSLDDEHCRRNEISRRHRPQGLGQGLLYGISGVGLSLLGAVGGIAHHPIQSLIEQGASPSGLVVGITRGLVGVVAKPLGGAAELVAQTGQGLLNGTGWCEVGQQRVSCIPEPICTGSSSGLKYSWKMLSATSGTFFEMIEASKESSDSQWLASTILLTSEALFIVSAEEDSQEAVFALNEVECRMDPNDPTKFSLVVPLREDPASTTEVEGRTFNCNNERVVQFVMETSLGFSLDDNAPDVAEFMNKDKNSLQVTFSSSPSLRSAFFEMLEVVSNRNNSSRFNFL